MTTRTLWNGRIPQPWDLPRMTDWLAYLRRLSAAPDPLVAAHFKEEAGRLEQAIKETSDA